MLATQPWPTQMRIAHAGRRGRRSDQGAPLSSCSSRRSKPSRLICGYMPTAAALRTANAVSPGWTGSSHGAAADRDDGTGEFGNLNLTEHFTCNSPVCRGASAAFSISTRTVTQPSGNSARCGVVSVVGMTDPYLIRDFRHGGRCGLGRISEACVPRPLRILCSPRYAASGRGHPAARRRAG
jgi:hypothetical protein